MGEPGGTTVLLERPSDGAYAATALAERPCGHVDRADVDRADDATTPGPGLGTLLRAPALVVFATIYLVEGYRWLGVLHLMAAPAGPLLFGVVGLALVALSAPVLALVLTSDRSRSTGAVLGGLLVAVAVVVPLATGTALVVGGLPWRDVAGTADLALAVVALGVVVSGERTRRTTADGVPTSGRITGGMVHGGRSVHGAP